MEDGQVAEMRHDGVQVVYPKSDLGKEVGSSQKLSRQCLRNNRGSMRWIRSIETNCSRGSLAVWDKLVDGALAVHLFRIILMFVCRKTEVTDKHPS